jgi:hypothetical protein
MIHSVDKLKEKFGIEHSDELFGIPAEIPQQCPRINTFISDVNTLKRHINQLEELIDDEANAENNKRFVSRELRVINEYIKETENSFEEMRTACENLRSWGTGWKRLARNLFAKVPNNKCFLEEKYQKQI